MPCCRCAEEDYYDDYEEGGCCTCAICDPWCQSSFDWFTGPSFQMITKLVNESYMPILVDNFFKEGPIMSYLRGNYVPPKHRYPTQLLLEDGWLD